MNSLPNHHETRAGMGDDTHRQTKLPALQFYPGDWRKDVGVQSLAYHDRGIWFEILMLMHESPKRGVLTLNGRAMPHDALARVLGLDNQILETCLTTLLTSGVASLEPDTEALMCRRMVRDEITRQSRAEAGKKGGNPVLLKQNPTTGVKQNPTTGVKQNPTPSSSSSVSSSEENTLARSDEGPSLHAVFELPLVDGSECGVPQNLYDEFVRAFPAVNVMEEFSKMRVWLLTNPKKRKTRRGCAKFINNWLSGAQDKGGGVPPQKTTVERSTRYDDPDDIHRVRKVGGGEQ